MKKEAKLAVSMLEADEKRRRADVAGAAAIRLGVGLPKWQEEIILRQTKRVGAKSMTARAVIKSKIKT